MDKLKAKVQNADWWEIGYLIIYGAIFTYEFLNTTMFEIQWPPRFGYIFLATSALYTIAKFIWHNTYTKKEMILSGVILFAFIMPALLTEYRFLWWVGFLIVGAKDVDFDKILKVYLTIGITIMVAAFAASQMGWIENLVYVIEGRGERNSFGIIYPTDFAAHVFYLVAGVACLFEDKIKVWKLIPIVGLATFVYAKCNARTSFLCMLLVVAALLFIRFLKNILKENNRIYYIVNSAMLIFAGLFLGLAHTFNELDTWSVKINNILSYRLYYSDRAIEKYEYKLFGQNIEQNGWGKGFDIYYEYFFLDDSYIRIALMYGVVLLLVVLVIFYICGVRAIKTKRIVVVFMIAIVALHSFMEHHLLEIAYNPFVVLCMANLLDKTKDILDIKLEIKDEGFKETIS